jgi:hypothetical protein
MITTLAACCLISSKPGVGNTAGLHGYLSQRIKCDDCDVEYSVEYEPSELERIENYEEKLLSTGQQKVNESHSSIGHPPIISIWAI